MAIGNVICDVCGNSFIGTKRAKYCSNKCKQHARYVRCEVKKAFDKIDRCDAIFLSHEDAKRILDKIKIDKRKKKND